MAKREYSAYQQDVIGRYYRNLDSITVGKLQELVTELYLADTDAKKKRLWERVEKAMAKLKVPPQIQSHILEKKDIEILAKNVSEWVSHSGR